MPRDRITLDEVRDYTVIDKHALDDDYMKQPQLMFDVSQEFRDARDTKRQAKLNVEELYAKLDMTIRAQAAEAGEKVTEPQIKMKITLHAKMKEAERELLSCEAAEDAWAGAMKAIESRGYAITGEAELYKANYFTREAGGKERAVAKEERAEVARNMRPQRRGTWEG